MNDIDFDKLEEKRRNFINSATPCKACKFSIDACLIGKTVEHNSHYCLVMNYNIDFMYDEIKCYKPCEYFELSENRFNDYYSDIILD